MSTEMVTGGDKEFKVRRLQISDKSKGFIELLQQLSVCDSVSDSEFEARFHELSSYGDDHVICVIEDDESGKIIATGSVFLEKKFLRNCGKVGHIEDVVVDSSARGLKLGQKIIEFLKNHAQWMGCYKDELLGLADDPYGGPAFRNQSLHMDVLYRSSETQQVHIDILAYYFDIDFFQYQSSLREEMGIQFVVDDSRGFSSIAADFLENIADEYKNTPVLLYAARSPG